MDVVGYDRQGELGLAERLRAYADREETHSGLVLAHRDDLLAAAEAVARCEAQEKALRHLAQYLIERHGCERYVYVPGAVPDDACGECVPCHAVGVVEGEGESVEALSVSLEGERKETTQ
jgi:hypothetical protein